MMACVVEDPDAQIGSMQCAPLIWDDLAMFTFPVNDQPRLSYPGPDSAAAFGFAVGSDAGTDEDLVAGLADRTSGGRQRLDSTTLSNMSSMRLMRPPGLPSDGSSTLFFNLDRSRASVVAAVDSHAAAGGAQREHRPGAGALQAGTSSKAPPRGAHLLSKLPSWRRCSAATGGALSREPSDALPDATPQ